MSGKFIRILPQSEKGVDRLLTGINRQECDLTYTSAQLL